MCFDKDIVGVYWQLITIAERRYYPHDHDSAYDLAAETVAKAICAKARYDETKPLLAWCRVIMHNTYCSIARSCMHYVPISDYDTPGGIDADQSATIRNIIMYIMKRRRKNIIVDTLIDYSKGYSIAEIANTEGLPVGTVKRRIHDARIMLKDALINNNY